MAPKAEKKPASKAPAEKKPAAKKTASTDGAKREPKLEKKLIPHIYIKF